MKVDEQWECWTLCEIKTEGTYRGEEGPTPETTACPEAGKVKARKKEKKMCTDVHAYHTYVSGVLLFLFASCKSSQGWLWLKKTMPEKNWIQIDEKICLEYIRRDNCKVLLWSKTRGTPQYSPSTRVSVLCKQTYYYGSKQQEEAVPIYSTTILYVRVSYCRCCRCIYVGYEWYVTGTCVNTLYTCQCQEM